MQFAPENWWINARAGTSEEAPSYVLIDAVEDSDISLIDRAGHAKPLENGPGYAASFHAEYKNAAKPKNDG